MSNSSHQNGSPDDDAASDIPLARRQPTEISLDEIEEASISMRPKAKQGGRGWLMVGLIFMVGSVGVGVWQWPWLGPRVEGVKAAIATGNFRLKRDLEPGKPIDSAVNPDAIAIAEDPAQPAFETTPEATADPGVDPGADPAVKPAITDPKKETPSAAGEPAGNPASDLDGRPDTLLNHRRYEEASPDELIQLNPNSTLKLQPAAQASVNAMIAKAKAEGVPLGVGSAFRTLEDQDYLYFKIKAERGQNAKTRAEVSAPPGYSEHHTGYAVDFIDESRPETNVEESFETTLAFKWLEKNAAFFNFEMSFPKGNESAVQYEPWHWRYVGDQDSLETFYANP